MNSIDQQMDQLADCHRQSSKNDEMGRPIHHLLCCDHQPSRLIGGCVPEDLHHTFLLESIHNPIIKFVSVQTSSTLGPATEGIQRLAG